MCLLGTHPWGEINDQGIHLTCFIIHSGERAETRVRERKRDDGRRGSKWVGVRSSWEGEKGSHGKENTGTVEKSFYMGFQFTALCFAIFMFLWFQYQFIAVKASTNCQSDRKIVANIFNIWDFEPNARISYFLMREIEIHHKILRCCTAIFSIFMANIHYIQIFWQKSVRIWICKHCCLLMLLHVTSQDIRSQ